MTSLQNLGLILEHAASKYPDAPALRVADGDDWKTWTYQDAAHDARRVAARLLRLGVKPGDRVVLFSNNRPEWTLADAGILLAGAITVPVYFNSSAEQVAHVVQDSEPVALIVAGQREIELSPEELPIVTMDPVQGRQILFADPTDEELAEISDLSQLVDENDCATIVYTSGTTGAPRGAMLSHKAFTHQIKAINLLYDLGVGDQSLCFLPLAHALERIWTYCLLSNGVLNTYVPNTREVADLLVKAQPNLLVAVPKFYDRVYAQAKEQAKKSKLSAAIFRWALNVGSAAQHNYLRGQKPGKFILWQLKWADKLVLSKIRKSVGGNKKVLISGGAPLRLQVEEFFSACGLRLGQGYGLTETGPMMTFFSPSTWKMGTVGYCIPGAELKLGDNNEIMYRGPNVMLGYWRNPEATEQTIDGDGFIHTGDVGQIDEYGYVTITDRLKDIIVTNGGKNVAPQPIEASLLSDPLFEQAVVLGNDRPFLTAILQPSREGLEELARQLALRWESVEELFQHPDIQADIERRISELTAHRPRFEQIRNWILLDNVITPESGLVTPTLKVKRREVERRFSQLIDSMYEQIWRN